MLNGLLHVDGFLSRFLTGFGFSLGYVVKHPAQLSVDVSSKGWSGLATNSNYSFGLYLKKHWLQGKLMTPLIGYVNCFLPATPLSPSQTIERLLVLTRCSSRALGSPRASGTEEKQRHS